MTQKIIFTVRAIAVTGMAALFAAGPALAESRDDVLERIRPIGRVNIAGQPKLAPKPAPASAVAAPAPAPAAAESAPVPAAPAAPAPAPVVAAALTGGEKTYRSFCFACHDAGVANAPKLGDKAAWEPRIATGKDAMLNTAKTGKNAMPPRGTCVACSDDDLMAAIEFMISKVQ